MKVFVILHSTDFEDCTYIIGINKTKRKAIERIEKDYPKYKHNTNEGLEYWEGNGENIGIYRYI